MNVEPKYPPELYHAALLKGHRFQHVAFKEAIEQDDHSHCVVCSQKIAEQDWPGVEHEGYVTNRKASYSDGTVFSQRQWVCENCFPKYRERLDWTVTDKTDYNEIHPRKTPPLAKGRALSDSELIQFGRKFPYALLGWRPEEVIAIAKSVGRQLSLAEAESFLSRHQRSLSGAEIHAGRSLIESLLEQEF